MFDLFCEVSGSFVWSCVTGKINVHDKKNVIEIQKKRFYHIH